MPKIRSVYRCQTCGFAAPKPGTCPDCARGDTLDTQHRKSRR